MKPMADRITFSDLLRMNTPVITGTQAAQAIGMDPPTLFNYAREDLDRPIENKRVQFPCQVSGTHLKIPRIPFLKWWGITDEEIKNKMLEG